MLHGLMENVVIQQLKTVIFRMMKFVLKMSSVIISSRSVYDQADKLIQNVLHRNHQQSLLTSSLIAIL